MTVKSCDTLSGRRRHGRVTRADVAREANVSPAVVTYSMTGSKKLRIAESTRERVREVAERLGYRPRFMHRALASGRNYAVGLIIPESRSLLFPFYELMIGGMVGAMNQDDYDPLLLFRSRWDRIDAILDDGRVDGLVLIASDMSDSPIEKLHAAGIPLVGLNRDVPEHLHGHLGCVYSDHESMIREAVQTLMDRGRRRLLNFGDPGATFANACREQTFRSILVEKAGHGVNGDCVAPAWDGGKAVADGIFDREHRWDGILCDGDRPTDAILAEAKRVGLEAGRDFDVVNINAYISSQLLLADNKPERPVLRGYLQQSRKLGETAWEMLKDMMEGKRTSRKALVPYKVYHVQMRSVRQQRGELL